MLQNMFFFSVPYQSLGIMSSEGTGKPLSEGGDVKPPLTSQSDMPATATSLASSTATTTPKSSSQPMVGHKYFIFLASLSSINT